MPEAQDLTPCPDAAPANTPSGEGAVEFLNVLDTFSGIGGFSLGLERTGRFKTVAFCEMDAYCQEVLKQHWEGIPIYDYIEDVTADRLVRDGIGGVDVITGGFPCQDVSTAGSMWFTPEGTNAPRSGLWAELARLIGEVRPRYAIMENVPNLLAGDDGRWFGRILGDLAKIGFDAEWHCIPASAFGAPHRRDRIWIIAYSTCFSKSRLPIRKKKRQPGPRDDCKNASNSNCKRLQGHGEHREVSTICTQKAFNTSAGQSKANSWRKEPVARLANTKNNNIRINPDWVEWLMGYPLGWTRQGTLKERLQGLGNAVVPIIPEYLGGEIINNE